MNNISGDRFETGCDLVDVTSASRPDTAWHFVDGQGHEHRWYVNGQPAASYNPNATYKTPTLIWIKDGEAYFEDGEPYDIGHYECRQCGEHVDSPRCTADTYTRHIGGLRWFRINDQPVSKEEHERRLAEMLRGKAGAVCQRHS